MNDLIETTSSSTAAPVALPEPRVSISIRAATNDDIPFIDGLQKKHAKMVGWMPRATLEGKIKLGHVLIAEEVIGHSSLVIGENIEVSVSLSTNDQGQMTKDAAVRVGYCIGNDRYFKRDDVGVIYQMNVVPGKQRSLIGASLLKAMFERSAYGCKLYCLWCAQDIAANRFWESLGFVPLAFRTGSRTKGAKGQPRVHIFWQRRIREGDTTTPYWFPSQTNSGSIREDRLVLPIPPGTHWSDAKPLVLPGNAEGTGDRGEGTEKMHLLSPAPLPLPRARRAKVEAPPVGRAIRQASGLHFGSPPPAKPASKEKAPRAKREKQKNDPRLIAAARELRDRWLEKVNAQDTQPTLGKYDIARRLSDGSATIALRAMHTAPHRPLLSAA